MLYGKIINGQIVYAPDTYVSSVITIENFNKDEALMKEFGYKKIVTDGYTDSQFITIDNMEELSTAIVIHKELDNSDEVINRIKQTKIREVNDDYNEKLANKQFKSNVKGDDRAYDISLDFQNELGIAISTFITESISSIFKSILDGKIFHISQLDDLFDELSTITFNGEQWKYSELKTLKAEIDDSIKDILEWKQTTEESIHNATDQLTLYRINRKDNGGDSR